MKITKVTLSDKVRGGDYYSIRVELEEGEWTCASIAAKDRRQALAKAKGLNGQDVEVRYRGSCCRGLIDVFLVLDLDGGGFDNPETLHLTKEEAANAAYEEGLRALKESHAQALID